MMKPESRKRQAKILKAVRKIHRITGAALFIFFFILGSTGLLLGWKKNSAGVILAKTYTGQSANPKDWLPLHVLKERAIDIARERISPDTVWEIDRFDVRPDKGIVKVLFAEGYWGVQLDCTTGDLLQIERRRSDFVENLHDGIILDRIFGTEGEPIKLVYTSVMGTALLTFTVSGFWLWYGPKRFKAGNRK